MSEEQLHDKIEQFLLLELSPDEATAFEAEIENDAALKTQVEKQRLALLGLERLATFDLKEKFDTWEAEIHTTESPGNAPTPRAFNVWKWISTGLLALLAVAVLLLVKQRPDKETGPVKTDSQDSLIALTAEFQRMKDQRDSLMSAPKIAEDSLLQVRLLLLQEELEQKDRQIRVLQNKGNRPNRQYAALFVPAFKEYNTRGDDDVLITNIKKAYNAQNFKQADALILTIPKDDPRREELIYIIPYVFFYVGKYEAAIPELLKLKEEEQYEASRIDWYLLLCYTADMQKHGVKAGMLLKEITSKPGHEFYGEAKKLEARLRADGVL
ncbi:MAG: hypothetical protein LCH81_12225 [Bacteroidetes bacterium]|nr:hypothetical protein [Bacteroidota bacterium]